ncbi:MAG: hypothetical protein ACYTFG_00205 [Planctomycetota bacterium]|jgi:hypothetical protein
MMLYCPTLAYTARALRTRRLYKRTLSLVSLAGSEKYRTPVSFSGDTGLKRDGSRNQSANAHPGPTSHSGPRRVSQGSSSWSPDYGISRNSHR